MRRLGVLGAKFIVPPVLDVDEPIPEDLPPDLVANLEWKLQKRGD